MIFRKYTAPWQSLCTLSWSTPYVIFFTNITCDNNLLQLKEKNSRALELQVHSLQSVASWDDFIPFIDALKNRVLKHIVVARFEVLTSVWMKIQICWDMMSCWSVNSCRHFGGGLCIPLHGICSSPSLLGLIRPLLPKLVSSLSKTAYQKVLFTQCR